MSHNHDNTTRICKICGSELPATSEHFRSNGIGGLRYKCRECERIFNRQYHQQNREQILERKRSNYRTNPEKERARSKEWVQSHPEYRRNYYLENREKVAEYERQQYLENREYILARNAEWAKNNPDKIREIQRRHGQTPKAKENNRRQAAQYRALHPEIVRVRAKVGKHKRRAQKMQNGGSHTALELSTLYLDMEGRCGYCGIPIYLDMKNDSHLDHMTPLSREGTNDISNLCYACPDCNLSKHDKTVDEWQMVRGW